jgi:hypothetical protein
MIKSNQRKLVRIFAIILILSAQGSQVNAQKFMNKLKDKLAEAAGTKGAWWQFYEDMDDKTKSTVTLQNIRFKVLDENTLEDDDNADGDGTRSSSIVQYKKMKVGQSNESIYINGSSHHGGFIKISDTTYMKICFRGDNEMKNLVLVKIYSQNEKFVTKLNKQYDKAEEYKTLEKYLQLYMTAWDQQYAANKLAAQKERDAIDAAFELPKPSTFQPLSQKQLMAAANAKYNESGKNKIAYCYFASPSFMRTKNQTEWAMIKENKTVNGTYDKFVTKRSLDVIIVMQYKDEQASDKYFIRVGQITEDAAFGVYDGSKFTGKYYFDGFGNTMGTTIPAANALKYKSALK